MKPGWQTSEFWIAVASQLFAILVFFGVVLVGDAVILQDAVTKIVIAVFTIVANGWVIVNYIKSRTTLKTQLLEGQRDSRF